MKFIIIFLAVIFLITSNTYPTLAAEEEPSNLRELSDKLVKESSAPGLVLLVRSSDGTLEIAASGIADLYKKTPMENDCRFFIGSISKKLIKNRKIIIE